MNVHPLECLQRHQEHARFECISKTHAMLDRFSALQRRTGD